MISTRSVELVIDTVVCLTLVKWETVSGQFGGYLKNTVDVVSFVDVLHQTSDARILLREAARVSRRYIVIKDHLREGPFAKATLQAMDWIGNYGHDVVLPYNYLSEQEWHEHFR